MIAAAVLDYELQISLVLSRDDGTQGHQQPPGLHVPGSAASTGGVQERTKEAREEEEGAEKNPCTG